MQACELMQLHDEHTGVAPVHFLNVMHAALPPVVLDALDAVAPPAPPAPPLPVVPELHALGSHPPQLFGSEVMSTHLPQQLVKPAVQLELHTPAEQICPAAHTLPQVPQLAGSFARLVHAPEQLVLGLTQLFGLVHLPLTHACSVPHRSHIAPQQPGSLLLSVQPLPSLVRSSSGGVQLATHLPPEQNGVSPLH
jgi:hypothetical protein